MARRSLEMDVPPQAVFAVLADGYRYADWVIGTREIREVEPGWPAVGSRLHFTVGRWPLLHRDHTEVLEASQDRVLVLEAKGKWAGSARVAVELAERRGGCLVTLEEHPLRGPAARVHNPLLDALIAVRLGRMLRLLRDLARRRQRLAA